MTFLTLNCALLAACNQLFQPFATSCGTDDQISAHNHAITDMVATSFVREALGPNPETAYSNFTAEAKEGVSAEKFVVMFKGVQQMGPFKDLRVVHTYLAQVTGGAQAQRVVCGNLSKPEAWVAVNTKPGPAQAYVVLEAQALNNTWTFVLWLMPEAGQWRVEYSQAQATTIVDKTAEDLQRMAESELQENHNFNGFILYAAALQMAARGPFLQLGIQPEIQKRFENLKPPPGLTGQPPFDWKLGQSFSVLNVGPIGVGQDIYLMIDQQIGPWTDDKGADQKNHELITAFSNAYPEYRHAFAGIVARAHERGGDRGYGTVVENDKPSK